MSFDAVAIAYTYCKHLVDHQNAMIIITLKPFHVFVDTVTS